MDYLWTIDGLSYEEERNFLQGKPHVDGIENQEREKEKSPHRQGFTRNRLGRGEIFKYYELNNAIYKFKAINC